MAYKIASNHIATGSNLFSDKIWVKFYGKRSVANGTAARFMPPVEQPRQILIKKRKCFLGFVITVTLTCCISVIFHFYKMNLFSLHSKLYVLCIECKIIASCID